MRTLHVDTGRIWRGGQRQCALLCRDLARRGDAVHLVCRPAAPLGASLSDTAVRVHALPTAGEVDPLAVVRLAHLLHAVRPDLIAAHEAHGFALAALARRWMGGTLPLVYHRRVDVPIRRGWASRWKFSQARCFVCISRAVADVLAGCGVSRDRMRIIPSGIPDRAPVPGAREEVRAALGLDPDAVLIGTIAGLIAHKGHVVLLDAFARVAVRFQHAHLVLAGDGPLRAALQGQAIRLGLAQRVHILGERRDTDRLLNACDLFVLSSLTEGLGSVILDAFAQLVPVVATRAGGIPELVEDGRTGRLATPGDPDSLAAGITHALSDVAGSRALALAARERFLAEFTDRVMAQRTRECYEALLGE